MITSPGVPRSQSLPSPRFKGARVAYEPDTSKVIVTIFPNSTHPDPHTQGSRFEIAQGDRYITRDRNEQYKLPKHIHINNINKSTFELSLEQIKELIKSIVPSKHKERQNILGIIDTHTNPVSARPYHKIDAEGATIAIGKYIEYTPQSKKKKTK